MRPATPTVVLKPLRHLRLRLTLWYAGTFGAILVLLGGGLFLTIRHQFARHEARELAGETDDAVRRLQESALGESGAAVPAAASRRGPAVFLFDGTGTPLSAPTAPDWVRAAARRALTDSIVQLEHDGPRGSTLLLRAQRFHLAGDVRVAALLDRTVELEDRYASLLVAFGGAAAAGLLLVAGGGWLLVRQASAPVERAVEQQRRFVADAAHELRTPVTVLRSRAEVALQQERPPAEYRDALATVERESTHLARIVGSLFTLARADAGEAPPTFSRVFLDDIVLDAARSVSVLGRSRKVDVQVTEYEEAMVDGDPDLLRQLAMVLLDNAVKFTPGGGQVAVRVRSNDGRAELIVVDTGIGIDAVHLPHVYERFFRADEARGRPGGDSGSSSGAGLGLSIARWIVDLHGGTIQITSQPGRGTSVTVSLPRVSPTAAERQPDGSRRREQARGSCV